MALSDYIAVSITLVGAAVTQPAFNVLLIAGYNATFAGTRTYTSLQGVAADFAAASPEYQAANAAFAQNPAPQKIKIGKVAQLVAGVGNVTLAQAPVAANDISVTVNDQPISVTFTGSAAQTMAALAQAIAAVPGIASATVDAVNPNMVDIQATLGYEFSLTNATLTGGGTIAATVTTPAVTWTEGINAPQIQDDAWYSLVITDPTDANILNVAAWTEAQEKIFGASSADAAILTGSTTDVASVLQAKGYDRTFLMYHATAGEFPEAAWLAGQLINPPGSATWAFKALAAVTPDTLTQTQINAAKGKNCNLYLAVAGVKITDPGIMAGGHYIDTTFGLDWLQSSIQADVFALLATTKKIPYTDGGAQQVASVVRTDLNRAIAQGVLANDGSLVLNVPKVGNQTETDRTNRYFPDITFSANLAGAIQKVQVRGTVSI